jgi:hypothetical protein
VRRLDQRVAGGGEAGAEVVDGIGGAEREGAPCRAGRAPARPGLAAEVEERRPPAAGRVRVERRAVGAELAGVEVALALELLGLESEPLDAGDRRRRAVRAGDPTLTAGAQATTRRCR